MVDGGRIGLGGYAFCFGYFFACVSASYWVWVILGLIFVGARVCHVIFVLFSPIICVLIYGALLYQILGRFVVFIKCIFVYGVSACLFWASSGVGLPRVKAWRPGLWNMFISCGV